jgi:hypothetical protein
MEHDGRIGGGAPVKGKMTNLSSPADPATLTVVVFEFVAPSQSSRTPPPVKENVPSCARFRDWAKPPGRAIEITPPLNVHGPWAIAGPSPRIVSRASGKSRARAKRRGIASPFRRVGCSAREAVGPVK